MARWWVPLVVGAVAFGCSSESSSTGTGGGGASNAGGATGVGGLDATGGSVNTGGSNTGGSNTGGSNTGGSNTGGSNTGGSAAGGSNAGGSGTGGSGTGGSGTGGSGTGGSGGSGGGGGVNNTPCVTGPGYALWRLAWPSNAGGYATVQAWDNGCTYSLADQACRLSGEPHDYANFGPGVVFNSSTDFFRVRFSVQGLSFSTATLYISAHADGSGIPNGVLESPIYGNMSLVPTVPISQHKTYAVDWTSFLSPTDPPSLTAVTLRSMPTGLAVSFMELCVQ